MLRVFAMAGVALAISAGASLAEETPLPIVPEAGAVVEASDTADFKPKFLKVGQAQASVPAPPADETAEAQVPGAEQPVDDSQVVSYLIDGGVEEPQGGELIVVSRRRIDG